MPDGNIGNSIPSWIAIKSARILDGFYNGDSTLYNSATLNAWMPPVLVWSSFVIALWLTLLAITVFLRKQWTENERLNYPIVQLPLALTSNPKRFFTSPWMWLGFALAGSLAKAIVLKIGGVKLYRQAVPFFLGLILADYTLGCVWSLIGLVLEIPTYIVWH